VQTCISFLRVGLKSFISARPLRHQAALACAAALLAALVGGPPAHAAGTVTVVAKYEVSIAGVALASIKFSGDIDERGYTLSGRGDSSRLVDLIAKFEGRGKSAGAFAGAQVLPASYTLKIKADKLKQSVDMRFTDGAIDKLAVNPALKDSPGRIPVEPSHRVGVIDPLSALILPMTEGTIDGESACDRRLPIFDGRYRYDLVLSYVRTETSPVAGKSKERTSLFVCKIKYNPIAGHKPQRKSTRYWQNNEGMEIWLAPVTSARVFVPHRAVMPSRVGPVVLSLSKLDISQQQQQAAITPDN
jgi:hypothetical protein